MKHLLLAALMGAAFATPSFALAPKAAPPTAGLVSGQLNFMLRTAGNPIDADRAGGGIYRDVEADIAGGAKDGAKMLKDLRALDAFLPSVLKAARGAMDDAIDPKHRGKDAFLKSSDSAWSAPLVRYIGENDEEDEPYYSLVNHALRSGKPVQGEYAAWIHSLREAMWHLPRYEGLSFRGARMDQARLDSYYQVGKDASDLGLISTSISPGSCLKFAQHLTNDQDPDHTDASWKNTAVVFVIVGKTGRPISYFAGSDEHEQEILFANGTPMVVSAKSPVFRDADLLATQIIVLTEK